MNEQTDLTLLIGETRDLETIKLAITVAETGQVGVDALHTNSGPISVD